MQLPGSIVNKVFSEVDVNEKKKYFEVTYWTMMELSADMAEGWKTAIGIDASVSMIKLFGHGMTGTLPQEYKNKLLKENRIQQRKFDGMKQYYFSKAASEEAIRKGYLKASDNIIEKEIKKFSEYLSSNLDNEGITEIVYWGMGENGDSIDKLGDFTAAKVNNTSFTGPPIYKFGQGSKLLPVMEYFERKYRKSRRSFLLLLTDGEFDDLELVKRFTIDLAKEIESKKRNLLKVVLLAVGENINEKQLIELDDLDTGTDIDIWDHKMAKDLRDVSEIFAELISEKTIVAPFGIISDSKDNEIIKFNDGVPAKHTFLLDKDCTYFILEVAGQRIKQDIIV